MQTVKFKSSGFLYYFHKIIYKNDPEDTCSYKSELILTFIISIVTIHATLLRGLVMLNKNFRQDTDYHGYKFHFTFIMISIISIFMGFVVLENNFDFIYWHSLSILEFIFYSFIPFFVGIVIVGIILGVLGLLIFSGYQCYKAISYVYTKFIVNKLPFKEIDEGGEPKTQVGVLYKSAKEKWCKKINWE